MKTLKNIFFVTVPTLLVLWIILEVFFRFVMPANQTPDYVYDPQYQLIKFSSTTNTSGLYTLNKDCQRLGHWSINNEGWNSPIDYQPKKTRKRIAIVGDSFVEAFHVDNDKNFARLVANELPEYEIYSFGISGAPLSHYMHMARYVNSKFDPDIIVFNIVHNDFDESITAYSPNKYFNTITIQDGACTEKRPATYNTSTWKKVIKRSALVNYLVNNIFIMQTVHAILHPVKKPSKPAVFNGNVNTGNVYERRDQIAVMLHYTMGEIKKEFGNKRVIFMMDAPRADIYAGHLQESNILFLNRMLDDSASAHGFEVIDLCSMFERDYNLHHKTFEFVGNAHWNGYAHQLVADTLAAYLKTH